MKEKPSERLARQQIVLFEYAEWADYRKWEILSKKSGRVVNKMKLRNIACGGSTVKCKESWNKIVEAIELLRLERFK